ncbi:MAG: DUF2891 domain-containing protein [Marinilabiliales bacterium]|nr:DUF2891 domain-containing protein [Marinilabiliales bacterium]
MRGPRRTDDTESGRLHHPPAPLPRAAARGPGPRGLARFADLALSTCGANKIAHVLAGDAGRAAAARPDAGVLRLLRLALVGARALAAGAARAACSRSAVSRRGARAALAQSLTPENARRRGALSRRAPGAHEFRAAVRPGLAAAARAPSCASGTTRRRAQWAAALRPAGDGRRAERLAGVAAQARRSPIRIGEHDQTAFAFGLVLDWARTAGDARDGRPARERRRARSTWRDRGCPFAYEPLGPGLPVALPRRGRPRCAACCAPAGVRRLAARVPARDSRPDERRARGSAPAVVTDPSDPKLGAPRRAEPEPRMDAGGDRGRAARRRCATPARAALAAAADRHRRGGVCRR